MKNFFKKLSFVLAIAMVLTSLAPATASAAAKNYIKDSRTGKKVTSIYVYVGGAEATLTPYVNGKKASKVTIVNSNPERATVDDKGTITPVANGNTTLTFTKGKTTIGKVTVKVRTRAKALNIYDRAEYAAGKKEKLSEVTLKVGEKKDLQITMPISKAAKKVVKKSTYFTYAEYDSSVVKVNKLGNGQRHFEVEAVAAGTTKVTIVANQKTEKNVRADKYYKEASFTVEVKDEKLTAEQTGAQKITVTGNDLTDKVADYTVKRGTVTLTIKEAKLSEDKKSVVLTSASSTIPEGEYTVKFGELEAAFTAVKAEVAEIKIDPEKAIMVDDTHAFAYFEVLNQFGEDVTNTALGQTVIATGSDGAVADYANKKVKFTTTGKYTMNLSQVSLALVCNTNGVNVSKILTVSEKAKLAEVKFVGIFKKEGGAYKAAELSEGTKDLSAYFLVFTGLDQYGHAIALDKDSVTVNLVSATGLAKVSDIPADDKVNNVASQLYALDLSNGFADGLRAGEVTVMSVCLTNGSQTKDTITVAAATKIAKLTVSAKDSIYGGKANELAFEAIDTNGKSVTDYATLKVLNNKKYLQQYPQVKFERNVDGSAKLVYTADANNNTVAVPAVLTFLTQTNEFFTANLSVLSNPVAKAIIGVDADVVLGYTPAGRQNISLKRSNFVFQDQYGNVIDDAAACLDTLKVTYEVSSNKSGFTVANTTGATVSATKDTVLFGATATAATTGALTVKVAIDGIAGSDYTFDAVIVDAKDVKDIKADSPKYVQKDNVGNFTVGTTTGTAVYGYYNGVKVDLSADIDDLDVAVTTIDAGKEGKVEKEGKATLLLLDGTARTVEITYKYANTDPVANFVEIPNSELKTKGYVTVASNAAVDFLNDVVKKVVTIEDQYGVAIGAAPSIVVTGVATDANNGKSTVASAKPVTTETVVHIKVVSGTTTYENDITLMPQ